MIGFDSLMLLTPLSVIPLLQSIVCLKTLILILALMPRKDMWLAKPCRPPSVPCLTLRVCDSLKCSVELILEGKSRRQETWDHLPSSPSRCKQSPLNDMLEAGLLRPEPSLKRRIVGWCRDTHLFINKRYNIWSGPAGMIAFFIYDWVISDHPRHSFIF